MTTIDVDGVTAAQPHKSGLKRRQIHGAALLSGLMMAGSFPHLDWGWLTWIGLVPILLTLPQLRLRSAIAQSFTFGVVYFGGLLYWLMLCGAVALGPGLGVVAWAIAVVAQSLVMMMFAAGSWWLSRRPSPFAWLYGVPLLWTVLEWVRQLGQLGTTWGDISVAQHANLSLIQISKFTGSWGITFVVVMVNVAISEIIRHCFTGLPQGPLGPSYPKPLDPPPTKLEGVALTRFRFIVSSILITGVVLGCGDVVLKNENLRPTYKAAALQPNIDPNVRWDGDRPADPIYVTSTLFDYVGRGSASGAQLVVWPETVFPGYLKNDPQLALPVIDEARKLNQTILVGTSERYPSGPEGNAVTVVSTKGVIGNSYLKRHLVPWGEYVPFRKIFPILSALHLTLYDRKFGDPIQPLFNSPQGPMGTVICYESSYPELTREEVARGAGILSIVTDDTWYGRTAAPYQHSNFAVLRAVENDRYVIRAAATGISLIVDPNGRVLSKAPLFTSKTLVADVESRHGLTFYSRHGDWFIWFSLVIIIALSALAAPKKSDHASLMD